VVIRQDKAIMTVPVTCYKIVLKGYSGYEHEVLVLSEIIPRSNAGCSYRETN
jgi:hypothetical protein